MAAHRQLILMILTFYLSCCSSQIQSFGFRKLVASDWITEDVISVPNLEFTNNFMIPSRRDETQVIVGNANGGENKQNEGCINILYLRNRVKQAELLGGDCGRESTDNYNDGVGRAVRMSYPDHGYHTKDGRYVLFVDKNSCARRLDMISLRVYTIIGKEKCGKSTLDLNDKYGTQTKVIGMVYIDEKEYWVFFVPDGIYIYDWWGYTRRKIGVASAMSFRYNEDANAGLLTKATESEYIVWQKVQYGVTRYDFTTIELNEGNLGTWGRTFKAVSFRESGSDPDARWKYTGNALSSGNGHVAQHPIYHELIMVSDWYKNYILLIDLNSGYSSKYCKQAPTGTQMVPTTVNQNDCSLVKLRNTMWLGSTNLASLVNDVSMYNMHELTISYIQNVTVMEQKCATCWSNNHKCYDLKSFDKLNCMCTFDYNGADCSSEVCTADTCNGHGECIVDVYNEANCTCEKGWRGENCEIKTDTFLLKYQEIIEFDYETVDGAKMATGFVQIKRGDPKVLLVGHYHHYWSKTEGTIGYYRLGVMSSFVTLAGDLTRSKDTNSYNDGVRANAHIMNPEHAHQTEDGLYILFIDSKSCARRMSTSNLAVQTVIGVGKCGNSTLAIDKYGDKCIVTGMVYLDNTEDTNKEAYWVISLGNVLHIYPENGGDYRKVASLKDVTINWSPFVGSMARKGNTVYLYVPHGLTMLNFSKVSLGWKKPVVTKIASLEKPKGLLKKTAELDYGASFRYDSNQNLYLGNWLGVIDVNPKHPEILAIADLNMKSVVIYNTTDGNALQVCRSARTAGDWSIKLTNSASTCLLVSLESVMWLSATSLLVTDSSVDDKVFLLRLKENEDFACASSPCVHGICSAAGNGFECLCYDDFTGTHCDEHISRTEPVYGALSEI